MWVTLGCIALVFGAYVLRGAAREQRLCQALLIELCHRVGWVGWPEFQKATGLSPVYRPAFFIAGAYLTRGGELESRKDPPLPGRKAPQTRYRLRRATVHQIGAQ